MIILMGTNTSKQIPPKNLQLELTTPTFSFKFTRMAQMAAIP